MRRNQMSAITALLLFTTIESSWSSLFVLAASDSISRLTCTAKYTKTKRMQKRKMYWMENSRLLQFKKSTFYVSFITIVTIAKTRKAAKPMMLQNFRHFIVYLILALLTNEVADFMKLSRVRDQMRKRMLYDHTMMTWSNDLNLIVALTHILAVMMRLSERI